MLEWDSCEAGRGWVGSWTSLVTAAVWGRGWVGSGTVTVVPGREAWGVANGPDTAGAGAYAGAGAGAAGVGGPEFGFAGLHCI